MSNSYELTVVYSPKLSEAKQKKVFKALKELLVSVKGKLVKKLDWGKKPLAYQILKFTQGYYLHWRIELPGEGVKAVESELRVNDAVLRYLLVKSGGGK